MCKLSTLGQCPLDGISYCFPMGPFDHFGMWLMTFKIFLHMSSFSIGWVFFNPTFMTLAVFVFVYHIISYPLKWWKLPQQNIMCCWETCDKESSIYLFNTTLKLILGRFFSHVFQYSFNISRIFIQKKAGCCVLPWEAQGVSWLERLKRLPEHLWIWGSGTQHSLGMVKRLGESDDLKCTCICL